MTDAAPVDELQASINAEIADTAEPVQTAPVEAEAETKAESATAAEEVETPSEPDGVQKRINKITADKYEQKRRADALEEELKALKANQQQTAPVDTKEPTPEDFDFDDAKYQAALIDYKINQRLSVQEQHQRQQQEQQKQEQINQGFNQKVAEFVETAPDYVEVVGNIPQLPQDTLNAVMQLDNGPQIAYYLGKHLDVADEIANSSPIAAAMRLGEIRAQLANPKPSSKPSAAPAPVETVTSSGSSDKDMSEMTMEEIFNL